MKYPLLALLLVSAATCPTEAADPAVQAITDKLLQARPLPLDAVRLTAGPLKAAQDADAAFLLRLDPDRALSAFRTAAGLEPKAPPLTGWDSAVGRQLTGHIAGHYLSALSLMVAATGDPRFKQRADYMISELATIQAKYGDGYLGAQQTARRTPGRDQFALLAEGIIRAGGENLNDLWSPWYVQHKMFAGLRDAYRHTGNKTALEVETKLAAWAEKTLAALSDDQLQKMLNGEFGGMNEVLADLYADTGDKRWLDLSYKFEHRSFIQPLAQGKDTFGGQHGNHNIPTLLGNSARYLYTAKPEDLAAADFFWKSVTNHHSFATGGNSGDSAGEMFPLADQLAAMILRSPAAPTNESCNVYSMLKLTRQLFALSPDAPYADYLERALFNHALAQINPESGLMAYHVSVGQAVRLDYQGRPPAGDGGGGGAMNEQYSCCVGTGMENPALYADGIYCHAADKLWINLYTPSTAAWSDKNAQLKMETDLPEGDTATLTFTVQSPETLTILLRRPAWTTPAFKIAVSGEPFATPAIAQPAPDAPLPPSTYIPITRTWKTGDTITLTIPKSLRLEPTPDDPALTAILWGPLVLAQDMGPAPARRGPAANNPVLITTSRNPADWFTISQSGQFHTTGRLASSPATPIDLTFIPLYQIHDHTYSVYMTLLTPQAWTQRTANAP